ncbi:MAG TPA: hypothetical protein VHG35_12145 [Gemmatimonadales bacterium]|nr:hypothetical protein [Gemmatimonadales bacterium]
MLAEHRAVSRRGAAVRAGHLNRFMSGAGGAAFAQHYGFSGSVFALSAGSVSAAFASCRPILPASA